MPHPLFYVAFTIIAVVGVLIIGGPPIRRLFAKRCPQCGKFGGRVTRNEKLASTTYQEWGYDHHNQEHRNMTHSGSSFLVHRKCDACENEWVRYSARIVEVPKDPHEL